MEPTEQVLGELARTPAMPPCCLLAEIGAALRLSGTVRRRPGKTVVEAEFPGYPQAARLREAITAAFGYRPLIQVLAGASAGKNGKPDGNPRYLLAAGTGRQAETLILGARLTDPAGRPLVGMPRPVVAGRRCDCAAGWRGAFLAAGLLYPPDRAKPALTVACPSKETALALAGAARRIGVAARMREYRGACQAVVDSADGIARLLTEIGSPGTAGKWLARWEEYRAGNQASPAVRPCNQGDLNGSNLTRSRQAAAASAMRTRRAVEILGDNMPGHLQDAARLRIGHPDAHLGQLGKMASPPLSKHTIAGRLRQLNTLANARAAELGISGTEEALPARAAS
jgi:DNA-binding protein WhiA